MKFEIKNRYTGEVQFIADIDCEEDTSYSVKLGLAVKFAIKENADLRNADLSDANLRNADLRNANLWNADLRNADLRNANLWNADLRNADLSDANLRNANLSDANLRNADLWNANLRNAVGNKEHIKTLQLDKYSIAYTSDIMQIGCERHAINKWWNFTDKEIISMDGKEALVWWNKWKPILQNIIEISPAEPTKKED